MIETLNKIANGTKNKFNDLANSSEFSKASDVAISVLSVVEQRRRSVSYLVFILESNRIFIFRDGQKKWQHCNGKEKGERRYLQ